MKHEGVQKLVQTNIEFGMVIRVRGELVTCLGVQPCPLAVVQSTTGAVLAKVQQSLSMATRSSLLFSRFTRAAVTDSYSAIISAERTIGRERGPKQHAQIHVRCQVHKTATVHTRTFAFLEPTISGMIRAALAVRNGPSMVRFREAMASEIDSRLEILQGVAPPEAQSYRKQVISVFVNHGSKIIVRRIIMVVCPNGG